MAKKSGKKSGKDKNYISVWQWLLLFLLFAVPCIGWIALGILAFIGDNILDFPGLDQRVTTAGEEAYADFGVRFFMLPNPMYGSWQ